MTPTITKFHGWPIAMSGFDDGERRIRDVDLGRMLGVSRVRDVRKLVDRYLKSGDLPGTLCRDTVARQRTGAKRADGKPVYREYAVTEHWLTMEDALFITAKSDTKKANQILHLVIKVFTAALRAHEQRKTGSTFLDRVLAPNKCEHSTIYTTEYVLEMNRLFGIEWNGGAHPRYLGGVQQKIYKMLLTKEVYAEMKRRIPEPHRGDNLHQLLEPETREMFQKELSTIVTLSRQSDNKEDFWRRMDREYMGSMLQLRLPETLN